MEPKNTRVLIILLESIACILEVAKFAAIRGSTFAYHTKTRQNNAHHYEAPCSFATNDVKGVQMISFKQLLFNY